MGRNPRLARLALRKSRLAVPGCIQPDPAVTVRLDEGVTQNMTKGHNDESLLNPVNFVFGAYRSMPWPIGSLEVQRHAISYDNHRCITMQVRCLLGVVTRWSLNP